MSERPSISASPANGRNRPISVFSNVVLPPIWVTMPAAPPASASTARPARRYIATAAMRDTPRAEGRRRRRVMLGRHIATLVIMLTTCIGTSAKAQSPAATGAKKFEVVETTIADIQSAIRARELTATELVGMYLARIKAFNGTCVSEPQGILGPVTPIPHAGSINALMTLNLRPASRKAWGFDD